MAVNSRLHGLLGSKLNITFDDSFEISNIFASEFNSSDISDRVLCFQFIEDDRVDETKSDDGNNESSGGNEMITDPTFRVGREARTIEKEDFCTSASKIGKGC